MIARSNVALNRALEAAMPGGGDAFQDHVVPEAIRSTGTVLDKVTGPGGATSVFDLKRVSQFYMDTRRGQEGWSAGDGAERPMAETRPHEWRFRHNVFAHDVYFPFLAGICGFEAHLHSYVAGSLTYGKKSCFDGLATNIDARGNLELAMSGGGGLGCNILVASAAAGLEASVRAAAEFSTSLSTAPPRLSAAVDLYSELAYSAFFRVRVLFWSKKWEKRLGGVRLFQKHAGIDFAPVGDPGLALCDAGADQGGDCEDSTASCDVTGRCVRYDFSSPGPSGEPKRVDVGACMLAPGGPQNRPFDIAIDTRQFIPSAIPGVASQEGRICPSTVLAGAVIPQGLPIDPQGAIALWTKEGLGMNATKIIFPEPYPVPAGIDVWFSGDSRMPTTRPDVTRRVGIHWNGRVKFYDGDGPILQDASYGSNGDASFQFLPNGCLVNAGHATLLPSMLPGPTTKATHPNAEYYVEAKYPLNPFAPTIKQKLSVTSFGVGNGNGEMTFLVKTRHTKFPWHETILTWGGEQYGLRNWQSVCPGPSIGAFNNFVNDQVWVRLGYQNGKKRVWVGEDALNGPWTEVSPNGWGQTITGTPAGCN
ncbi:MAG: hypothetical protein JST00_08915 [Deltaproteobacteria bacterium]|nr:hypothetical protein [Deltaproteobacteria bacterium]